MWGAVDQYRTNRALSHLRGTLLRPLFKRAAAARSVVTQPVTTLGRVTALSLRSFFAQAAPSHGSAWQGCRRRASSVHDVTWEWVVCSGPRLSPAETFSEPLCHPRVFLRIVLGWGPSSQVSEPHCEQISPPPPHSSPLLFLPLTLVYLSFLLGACFLGDPNGHNMVVL